MVEKVTPEGRRLHLRFAVDYSARDAIIRATHGLNGGSGAEKLADRLGPEVDLLIRTGGEQRLSDFLLWECAYAELYFTPKKWPDFMGKDLEEAVREFRSRERRFGRLPEQPVKD
jgi:undecaprenyl diphosphate synthase